MKKIISFLKTTMGYFLFITVPVMVAAASFVTFFEGWNTYVEIKLIWQLLLVSFLGSLSHVLFYHKGNTPLSKKAYYFRWVLCYLYINTVVLGSALVFEWFDFSYLPMVLGLMFFVAAAFLVIAACIFRMDIKTTEEINRKLQERNAENEEEN